MIHSKFSAHPKSSSLQRVSASCFKPRIREREGGSSLAMVNSIRRGMKRSGVAKNSGCLAFLNPGGRLADLISEILEAQEGSLRVSGSIDALSLLCALASSVSFSQLLPPRRTSRIRGIIFQIPKDALGISKQLLVRRPPPPCPNMLPPYLHSFIEETINNPFFFFEVKVFVSRFWGVSSRESLLHLGCFVCKFV